MPKINNSQSKISDIFIESFLIAFWPAAQWHKQMITDILFLNTLIS